MAVPISPCGACGGRNALLTYKELDVKRIIDGMSAEQIADALLTLKSQDGWAESQGLLTRDDLVEYLESICKHEPTWEDDVAFDRIEELVARNAQLEDLIKSVAHIGFDFGQGEFAPLGSHTKKARNLLNRESDMSINDATPQDWDRLKKEHPAIEIHDNSDSELNESYERLKKALQDNGHISKPFIDSQMQEAHDSIDNVSDGSTASYYELPDHASELQHLISHKNMNAQMGEIFRSCYRYGSASHSDQLRDAKKIKFYIEAEIERLETWSK